MQPFLQVVRPFPFVVDFHLKLAAQPDLALRHAHSHAIYPCRSYILEVLLGFSHKINGICQAEVTEYKAVFLTVVTTTLMVSCVMFSRNILKGVCVRKHPWFTPHMLGIWCLSQLYSESHWAWIFLKKPVAVN